jgi:hypothetical protein
MREDGYARFPRPWMTVFLYLFMAHRYIGGWPDIRHGDRTEPLFQHEAIAGHIEVDRGAVEGGNGEMRRDSESTEADRISSESSYHTEHIILL